MENFSNWLSKEIEERQISYSEIDRRDGPSHARISQVISGGANPGLDFCIDIADAMGIPPIISLARVLYDQQQTYDPND